MIAWFAYASAPSPSAIILDLGWGQTGERLGTICVHSDLMKAMQLGSYPPVFRPGPLESALPYAIFLALRAQRPLTISGDPAVWNPLWGPLYEETDFAAARTPLRLASGTTPVVGSMDSWLSGRFGLDERPSR